MNEILQQLIQLSVEFEGNLRVAAARDSQPAISAARDKFDRMAMLMAALSPSADTEDSELKDDEATAAEESPAPEPDSAEVPESAPVA